MSSSWFQPRGDDLLGVCHRQIDGHDFMDASCYYPTVIQKTYLAFEEDYSPFYVFDLMAARPWVPIVSCLLYGVMIVGGQAYMRDRERFHWRSAMAAWNLGLSLFSLVGFVRTVPNLVYYLMNESVADIVCSDPSYRYGVGSHGLWSQLFCLSKIIELLDTFFIVIHKKRLIFLHWYHHVTVLLYCWHAYMTKSPAGIVFIVMNFGVHAVMYFYYFLMTVKLRPKWLNPMVITVAQISQMFVGVSVTLATFFYSKARGPEGCAVAPENNLAAFVMYGSYLFLFLQFFVGRYYTTKTTIKLKKKKKVV